MAPGRLHRRSGCGYRALCGRGSSRCRRQGLRTRTRRTGSFRQRRRPAWRDHAAIRDLSTESGLMADDVLANGREISCQAASSKSIAAFPDVCMTPPENPATPPGVPVPYPNFGMASDTTNGSKTVKINGKPVMLKNESYFKKSSGDEAGAAAKKG